MSIKIHPPTVYLAGPVDHTTEDHRDGWRHGSWLTLLEMLPYCPICNAVDFGGRLLPDWEIMQRNRYALMKADAVVAFFDTNIATFGTPIEIYQKVGWKPGSIFLVHRGTPGVFVRDMAASGEIVLGQSFLEAREWLKTHLALQ